MTERTRTDADEQDDDEREAAPDQESRAAALEREWQDSEQDNRGQSDN